MQFVCHYISYTKTHGIIAEVNDVIEHLYDNKSLNIYKSILHKTNR